MVKEIENSMAKHELEPDLEFIDQYLQVIRGQKGTVYGNEMILKRMDYELSLLDNDTQLKLMDTMERSIKSQDRLANSQLWLTLVGTVIALLQLVGIFIV